MIIFKEQDEYSSKLAGSKRIRDGLNKKYSTQDFKGIDLPVKPTN